MVFSKVEESFFRYAVRNFNLDEFTKTIKKVKSILKPLQRENFKNVDFNKYSKEIKKSFKLLAKIKGIQKTGASKILHLLFPEIFVMWDGYVRNYYGFKKGNECDYLNFLKLMQKKFCNIRSSGIRTVTKLIDEHNYKTISMPALNKKKIRKAKNKC